jgi:hypothetical protein
MIEDEYYGNSEGMKELLFILKLLVWFNENSIANTISMSEAEQRDHTVLF